MPEEVNPSYSRGKYRLEWDRRSDGTRRTPHLQIVWYDPATRRNRSRSTGTSQIEGAEDALDRLYLERERGQSVCHTCGRPIDSAGGHLLTVAIADYILAREDRVSAESIRPRLKHALNFFDATGREGIACDQVDEAMIEQFRKWSAAVPVIEGGKTRKRALGTTEATVRTLAAVINFAHRRKDTPFPAGFSALPPLAVSRTPTYRSDVKELAAMFRYCLDPMPAAGQVWSDGMRDRMKLHRRSLLRFLQISVATWARPDAAHDFSVDPARDQWSRAARVIQLNPKGRRQTKKYRPVVPVPERFAQLLDHSQGFFVPVKSVRKAFEAMQDELGLPRERETGLKLIRRSVAQHVRGVIGEERWQQGEMMLGHRKASTSDLYALFDPANLGTALAATSALVEQIEALSPGAFSTAFTGDAPGLRILPLAKNG